MEAEKQRSNVLEFHGNPFGLFVLYGSIALKFTGLQSRAHKKHENEACLCG